MTLSFNIRNIFSGLLCSAMILGSLSCKKNNTVPETISDDPNTLSDPTANMTKLGEVYVTGANAKALVYTSGNLQTGYNEIYVSLYDSTDGSKLTRGHFDIVPMMNMGMMQHSCPVENSEDTLAKNGLFRAAVVFSMPGTSLQWSLKLYFHNHKNEKEGMGQLGVNVVASNPVRFKSAVLPLDSNSKVFISMILPGTPKVGINDISFVLHRSVSMMDFPPLENYSIEIEPYMPGMGHGSPNNINPLHTGIGHYTGKANFTMTGLWQVKLKLFKNGILISNDQYFEITL